MFYMKKILLPFDGSHFSEGAFEFARSLNEMEPILLLGVFIPQVNYANLWSYASAGSGPLLVPLVEEEESETVHNNIERFEKLCQKNNIDYRVHKDFFDFALPELKKETRFADIAILSSESFYKNLGTGVPNEYLKEILHSAECPVLVVPEKFNFPESNILAFDGSESSVYAIKQFAYLFPELSNNRTLLVYADEEEKAFPQKIYIEELAARHFSNLTLFKLDMNPKKYFTSWIREKKSAILVCGAYGRASVSQLFKRSFVSDVISDHQLPLFITHR
jgi:hypothetical protein